MNKGTGTPENRELAFMAYALFGGKNIPKVLQRLQALHGIRISARTLYRWRDEGGWQERMAALAGGSSAAHELTFDERMLGRMMSLIERFEAELAKKGADSQTAYAYTNLVRTAIELSRNMAPWESRPPAPLAPRELPSGEDARK